MATRSSRVRRIRLTPFRAALAIGALTVACSGQGSVAKLSDDSPLFLEVSQTAVTVHNRTGLPLTDVTITIVPYGPLKFTKSFSRVENSEKREIPLSEFSDQGTPFNPRFHKAKSVRVEAKDVLGKPYDIQIPWS